MGQNNHIIRFAAAIYIAGLSLTSCIYEDEGVGAEPTIGVNTTVVQGARGTYDIANDEDPFALMFWLPAQANQLADPDALTAMPSPYLMSVAPQPVPFYSETVYDTGYPYPYPYDTKLCATGYAPSRLLEPTGTHLLVNLPDEGKKGRYDFLGCDLWRNIYSGSQTDPFAQEKNRLYFRHLAAKLVFYADRDKNTMENMQFVRNVRISNISMKVGAGDWQTLHTPAEFVWSSLSSTTDFPATYLKVINNLKSLNANEASYPEAGYKTYNSTALPQNCVFSRNPTYLIPIEGAVVDSCFVCNPITKGTSTTGAIKLKMDISAELSFSLDFPVDDAGSTTDDLTFTRTWNDVIIDIKEVAIDAQGNTTIKDTQVTEFKPGNEYRIYLHFFRTGINLTALEMPWDYGGVHYITISGGEQPASSPKRRNE